MSQYTVDVRLGGTTTCQCEPVKPFEKGTSTIFILSLSNDHLRIFLMTL